MNKNDVNYFKLWVLMKVNDVIGIDDIHYVNKNCKIVSIQYIRRVPGGWIFYMGENLFIRYKWWHLICTYYFKSSRWMGYRL